MEKEFVPYEQSLALKELGFDEENIVGYYRDNRIVDLVEYKFTIENYSHIEFIPAPLYQQAFRWFREKYNIECYVNCYWNEVDSSKRDYYANYNYGSDIFYSINIGFKTYEEAELECLKKLIEIVKDGRS